MNGFSESARRRKMVGVLALVAAAAGACVHEKGPVAAPMPPPLPVRPAPAAPSTAPVTSEQSGAAAPAKELEPASGQQANIDPVGALERMAMYLRSLSAFAVEAQIATDEVLESGQKIQFDRTVNLRVRRPTSLRADVKSAGKERSMYYDGKTFTLFSPKLGYYATVPAPPTLKELTDVVSERYDVEIPLADLFLFGTDDYDGEEIKSAIYVGPDEVLSAQTDHYAFRQDDVDWQVWIERGDKPLPRKIVITTKREPAQPQHVAVYKWDLNPVLAAGDFSFVPQKDAVRIEFASPKKKP